MDFNETMYKFRPAIWISDLAISSFLALVSLYLLVALIFHQLKVEKPRKQGFFQLPLEKRYRLLSLYICIFIDVASFIRHVNSMGLLLVEGNAVFSNASMFLTTTAAAACNILPPIGNITLTIGSGFVYLFLWFRQRIFYVHSSLKVLNNKCVRVFSMCQGFQFCNFNCVDSLLDIVDICLLYQGPLSI